MTSPDTRVPLEMVDIEDARFEMHIDLIERAGWLSAGGHSGGTRDEGYYRQNGRYMLSPGETAIRLGLIDDNGVQVSGYDAYDPRTTQVERFGYDVETDSTTGEVVITYSGTDDERYKRFFNDLLTLGHDLNSQQERETGFTGDQDPNEVSTRLCDATNKLIAQFENPENDTLASFIEATNSRTLAIKHLTKLSADTFCKPEWTDQERSEFLQSWDAHIAHRYLEAYKALRSQYTGDDFAGFADSNPVLGMLKGMGAGVYTAIGYSE